MLQLWLFTLLTLAICCSTTFANTFTVMVKVVEGDKMPVAKADVALFWDVESGVMRPRGENAVVTDADGKALLRVDDWNERRPVLVLSAVGGG